MNVRWSGPALEQLSAIRTYISENNPENAERFVHALYDKVSAQLTFFPRSGHAIHLNNKEYGELIYRGKYRIIYSLAEEEITILTVRSTRQKFSPSNFTG